MVRRVGPAAAHERALARLEAVQTDGDLGERPREHRALPSDLVRDLGEEGGDRGGDVGRGEEVARGRMPELFIEVQHLGGFDRYAAGRGDAGLDGDVGDVLGFLRAGRLHLGQAVAVAEFREHVDRDEGVFGDERRLEDRRRARVERFLRGGDALGAGVVRQVDQDAARAQQMRQGNDVGVRRQILRSRSCRALAQCLP